MGITRIKSGDRMSQAVVYNGTVNDGGAGGPGRTGRFGHRTNQGYFGEHRCAFGRGWNGQVAGFVGNDLAIGYRRFCRDERGLGHVGFAGQHANTGLRRIQTCIAEVHR